MTRSAAVDQDGSYPRPQMLRSSWVDLGGSWEFAIGSDPDASASEVDFDLKITVPFPPESSASGLARREPHTVVWYRRSISAADLADAGHAEGRSRLLLHFGAVDHEATVWLGGQLLGGHTVVDGSEPLELIVRAIDDANDVEQPRGKQDWREHPHSIWYQRTTGIWQTVWLEAVPATHVTELSLVPDALGDALDLHLELNRTPSQTASVEVSLDLDGELLARYEATVSGRRVDAHVVIERLRNGQAREELWWSPEDPTLIGVVVVLRDAGVQDVVHSYTGLRTVAVEERSFVLNDRPYPLRAVLEQGYWPQSHLAAPSPEALRDEVAAIKRLGFNAVRLHQKAEVPGFLYWADRLGLLVWVETANAYSFTERAVRMLVSEWADIVRRDRSHPSVVAWVPLNESWGVQQIAHVPAQRHYARALSSLTRALDDSRPVISNDGWEHVDSDIWTIHDYAPAGRDLRERYGTPDALLQLLLGFGPAGRRIRLDDAPDRGQPFMLTEFGGVSYDPQGSPEAWGYSTAESAEAFEVHLAELMGAINDAIAVPGGLAGYCYTQLADTGQETNGLLYADRTPKLPWEALRRIVVGADARGGPGQPGDST